MAYEIKLDSALEHQLKMMKRNRVEMPSTLSDRDILSRNLSIMSGVDGSLWDRLNNKSKN